jgi:hypothetical protein
MPLNRVTRRACIDLSNVHWIRWRWQSAPRQPPRPSICAGRCRSRCSRRCWRPDAGRPATWPSRGDQLAPGARIAALQRRPAFPGEVKPGPELDRHSGAGPSRQEHLDSCGRTIVGDAGAVPSSNRCCARCPEPKHRAARWNTRPRRIGHPPQPLDRCRSRPRAP